MATPLNIIAKITMPNGTVYDFWSVETKVDGKVGLAYGVSRNYYDLLYPKSLWEGFSEMHRLCGIYFDMAVEEALRDIVTQRALTSA